MDKHIRYTLIVVFLGLMIAGGCGVNRDETPKPQASTSDIDSIEAIDATNMPALAATKGSSSPIAVTPSTPLPTSVIGATNTRLCQVPPQRFRFSEALGIERLAALRFETENLVRFEGWTQRPEPTITPITPESTPFERPEPGSSYRILLKGGQLDLTKSTIDQQSLNVDDPLANPCGEACPLEVIGQSPNGKWQLIQISDWLREKMGLWLVSDTASTQLIPYVPADPKWRWAADNSSLWLSFADMEQGGHSLVVQLNEQPGIKMSEYGSLLDPNFYFLDYSPLDHTVRAVPSYELGNERADEVFTIWLGDGLEEVIAEQSIPGIVSVNWNEATQSFVAQTVTEDGVTFRELSGALSLTIPRDVVETLFPSLTSTTSALQYGISALGDSAISRSGGKLALVHSPGEIWVFDCLASP